ncbi:peptidylprolyl isomerase [Nocardioides rubriscoriae]|uniref:peptidylprolyl isomerase n=1 Tax=Nocardioides rubriscoriae TaxID=642762 RepID=UPI001FE89E28|nr:peptidylprolyl isomerase [Nocardioides rubriscoriae]
MVKRRWSRSLAVVAALVLASGLAACGDDNGDGDGGSTASDAPAAQRTHAAQPEDPAGAPCTYSPTGEPAKPVDPPATTAAYSGSVAVTIETGVGDLAATLDAAATPCTVNSFTSLASQGYFDDTSCHRLTTSGIYVLQCGDPTGTGAGGPGYAFGDELTGSETYAAGTLAMANAGPGTNGSPFFVVYQDSPLPPSYTVFGTIDDASVAVVADVAKAGTDDANGPGDGAPKTAVDISFVEVGQATDAPPSDADSATTAPAGTCTYTPDGTAGADAVDLPPAEPTVKGEVAGVITTDVGRIPITLDAKQAPCTVGSFVSLAEQGYFDGVACHRLTTQGILVLQCGDPTGTGGGGPGYSFPDELSGTETYPTGTLAMANAGPDTNGSQFFIVYGKTPLPPSYTVFGTVAPSGVKVVEKVAAAGVKGGGSDGPPKTPITFTKVAIS